MERNDADGHWVDRTLRRLPTTPVPQVLEARILKDFDRLSELRNTGLRGWLSRATAAVWPGAPVWRPAMAFGAALAIGLALGVLMPLQDEASASEQSASIMLDTPPTFEIGENS